MRRHLAEYSLEICRSLFPKPENLRANDRPVLDAVRRRRNGQGTRTELAREILQAVNHAYSKPRDGADDDQETDDRDDRGRRLPSAAQMNGEPVIRRIQRNSQDHSPGEHRYEWTNKNERPIEQEGQQGEPDRQLYDLITRPGLPKSPHGRRSISRQHYRRTH